MPNNPSQLDQDGRRKVYMTHKPSGTTTYFTGAGDDQGKGDGDLLILNLSSGDTSKSVTMTFDELVYIKEGTVITCDAPLGACFSVEVLNPSDVLLSRFVNRVPLLGSNRVPIETEDIDPIPAGYKVKVTVFNSDGNGEAEAAAAFKFAGLLEFYRGATV